MDLQETVTHAFVIRLWLEKTDPKGRGRWRGHITHVLTGRRVHVEGTDELLAFIEAYLTTSTGSDD